MLYPRIRPLGHLAFSSVLDTVSKVPSRLGHSQRRWEPNVELIDWSAPWLDLWAWVTDRAYWIAPAQNGLYMRIPDRVFRNLRYW